MHSKHSWGGALLDLCRVKIICKTIMVKSMAAEIPSNHYFTQYDKVRDNSLKGLLMKMYEHDFVEP